MGKGKVENGILTWMPEGRIDAATVKEFEEEIEELLSENPDAKLVIDAERLAYLSSVGLRLILKLKKQRNETKIIEVNSAVYEIFEMTGFTEMMDIRKAFRRISVEGCEQIGCGSNGSVYRYNDDTVVKVYHNPDSLPDIERERLLAKKALVLGIPTAIPYDVVRVGDTYGSVFELLKAGSFAKIAANHPERLDELTREFVKLMKQIHSTEVKPGDMPSMKNVAQNWAKDIRDQLPEDKQAKLERMLEEIPDCHTMLHGDYHFKNVMEQNGEILLVDMDTLCQGHPIFEFASTYLGFVGFGAIDPDATHRFMGLAYETTCRIWNKVLDLYFEGESDETRKAVESKARIIAYVRLLRRTLRREPENVKRLAFCKDNLNVLLDTVSSLTF